jgi:hypothetical protein
VQKKGTLQKGSVNIFFSRKKKKIEIVIIISELFMELVTWPIWH